jgi:antitoxin HicB
MTKTARDYLREPYSRTLIPAGDGTYFAEITEFRGCFAEGQTPGEAYVNLERVAESWIEAALSQGQEIPTPFAIHDFSGRIAFRIPRSIHKQAAKFAEMDGTSLNQFFLAAVAARLGAEELYERLSNKLEAKFMPTTMPSYIFNLHGALKLTGPVNMIAKVYSSASPEQTFFPLTTGGVQMTSLGSQIIEEEA